MAFRFIAVALYWLIAVRSGPERLRAVSGTESARAGFPANKASSRLACPVAEAARAGAASKAKGLCPPPPLRIPVQPIAGSCRAARQDLAGMTDVLASSRSGLGCPRRQLSWPRLPETRGTAGCYGSGGLRSRPSRPTPGW